MKSPNPSCLLPTLQLRQDDCQVLISDIDHAVENCIYRQGFWCAARKAAVTAGQDCICTGWKEPFSCETEDSVLCLK